MNEPQRDILRQLAAMEPAQQHPAVRAMLAGASAEEAMRIASALQPKTKKGGAADKQQS